MIKLSTMPAERKQRPRLSALGQKAQSALRQAVRQVIQKSRRTGVPIAVWRDGKVVLVHP